MKIKKLLTILFFLFLFLSWAKKPAFSQYSNFLVPGINCGIAGDIAKNKCCAPMTTLTLDLPDLGSYFTIITDLVRSAWTKVFDKQLAPLLALQSKYNMPCLEGSASESDYSSPNCRCISNGLTPTPGALIRFYEFCDKLTNKNETSGCKVCAKGGGVWTGIGCVQGDIKGFIGKTVFGIGIGLAGTVSLLCIIYAAFMMQSSQGNPEKLKKAQELLTSCIMGFMLIIFSVFILRLIGVDILRIPGFS